MRGTLKENETDFRTSYLIYFFQKNIVFFRESDQKKDIDFFFAKKVILKVLNLFPN